MNITVINGTEKQGVTYRLKEIFLAAFRDKANITEYFLPKDCPSFCMGCLSCTLKGESTCKDAEYIERIDKSLLEADYKQYALDMEKKAEEKGVKLMIPVDTVVADDFSNDANFKVVGRGEIPDDMEGLDIGPETEKLFADAINGAKTVVWNGPMGCFEMPNFAKGTIAVAEAMAKLEGATTIIGGGDSASACNNLGFGDKMTHISTGGGASLEFLEGKELPGVAAANDK